MTPNMIFEDDRNNNFGEILDQEIINTLKERQFVTAKEIWASINIKYVRVSPALIYSRINQLADKNIVGYMEEKIGEKIFRRFYCFSEYYKNQKPSIDRYL